MSQKDNSARGLDEHLCGAASPDGEGCDQQRSVSRAETRLKHVRHVACPRCHQQCGWCSDYRWMHGTLKLPGSRQKCRVPGMEPEGDACPVCKGARTVWAVTTYSALRTEPSDHIAAQAARAAQVPPPIREGK